MEEDEVVEENSAPLEIIEEQVYLRELGYIIERYEE